MIARRLSDIAAMLGASIDPKWAGVMIQGVSIDTRTLQPGNLYVPIRGERFDGHDFARQAIEGGASAMLWDRDAPGMPGSVPALVVDDTLAAVQRLAAAYRRQLGVRVVGITGSNGKTSTKDLLAAMLGVRYKTHKTPGNLNNHLGVPLTLLAMEEDTECAVVEMGMSDLGEIRLLSSIAAPDIAIITNVSEVHLGDLHTRERILQAKLEIAEGLSADGLLIVHGDNPQLAAAVAGLKLPCPYVTFGEGTANRVAASHIQVTKRGVSFTVGGQDFAVPVLGKHQAVNALAAIAAARHAGLSDDHIRQGLREVRLTGMRSEWIEAGGVTIINDAYKSNPSSARAALELIYALQPFRQKIAVLGEMTELGEESPKLHREIGRALDPQQLDYVLVIGDMARHIAAAARERFDAGRVMECTEREELLIRLKEVLRDGSLVLVKGSRKLGLERIADALKEEVQA